jgi:tetratricopeptide (TPR) repeat protein
MPAKAMNAFLSAVFENAVEICGQKFASEINALRRERERLLSGSWRELPEEEIFPGEKEEVFREIDYDTIILNCAKYLKGIEYLSFLYKIAEIAIGFGEYQKAHRLLDLIITRYRETAGKSLLAKAHHRLGDIALYQGDHPIAQNEYRKSYTLYDDIGDKSGIATITNLLGVIMMEEGKPADGETYFIEAKKIAVTEGITPLLVKINLNLGNMYTIRGHWDEAITCYKEALSLLDKRNDYSRQAQFYHNMAVVYKWQGDYDSAMRHLEESIKLSRKANNLHEIGLAYLDEAEIYCYKKDFSSSTSLATTAFQIFSKLGDRLGVADVYRVFGMIYRESGHFDQAWTYFKNSLRINRDYNNPLNLGETLSEMGYFYQVTGDKEKAKEHYELALKYFQQIQAKAKIEKINNIMSTLIH